MRDCWERVLWCRHWQRELKIEILFHLCLPPLVSTFILSWTDFIVYWLHSGYLIFPVSCLKVLGSDIGSCIGSEFIQMVYNIKLFKRKIMHALPASSITSCPLLYFSLAITSVLPLLFYLSQDHQTVPPKASCFIQLLRNSYDFSPFFHQRLCLSFFLFMQIFSWIF